MTTQNQVPDEAPNNTTGNESPRRGGPRRTEDRAAGNLLGPPWPEPVDGGQLLDDLTAIC